MSALAILACLAVSLLVAAAGPAVGPYSCSGGSWQGDANFSRPTEDNAVRYKKMSESFLKLPFNELEFLRCGRESERFDISEDTDDLTQLAQASHGVNAQCLHCLRKGCGYCFVENVLEGQEAPESPQPGEAPTPDVQISARSQCFYDPSPSGALCEQRLETHSCLHRRPLYISSEKGCYTSEKSVVQQTSSMCTLSMSKQLLLPPHDLDNISLDLTNVNILAIDPSAGSFEAEATLTLKWTDKRLVDRTINPCGSRWLHAEALSTRNLVWDAFEALDGDGFVNALDVRSLRDTPGSCALSAEGEANKIFDSNLSVIIHTRRFRGSFALATDPNQGAAKAFPVDTHLLPFEARLASPEYTGLPHKTHLLLARASDFLAESNVSASACPASGTPVGGGFYIRSCALTQGARWSQDRGGIQLVGHVMVWRGSATAASLIAGYVCPYLVTTVAMLLSPTHYQHRTQRTLLSPAIAYRFLVVASVFPAVMLHQERAKKLLEAGEGTAFQGRPNAPTTLSDQMAVATLSFASVSAAGSALVADLNYRWVHPEASTRREQDFNRRIFYMVGLIDHLFTTAIPLCFLAIIQYLVVLASAQPLPENAANAPASNGSSPPRFGLALAVSLAVLVLGIVSSCLLLAQSLRRYFRCKMADLERQFKLFDTDSSGDLSIDELLVALSNYGYADYEQAIIMLHLLGPNWLPGGASSDSAEGAQVEVSQIHFVQVMGSPWLALKLALQSTATSTGAKDALALLHAARELRAEAARQAAPKRPGSTPQGEEARVLPPVLVNLPENQLLDLEMHLRVKRAARQVVGQVVDEASLRVLQASAHLEVLRELSGLQVGAAAPANQHAASTMSPTRVYALPYDTKGSPLPPLKARGGGQLEANASTIRHRARLESKSARKGLSKAVVPAPLTALAFRQDVESSVVDALLEEGRQVAGSRSSTLGRGLTDKMTPSSRPSHDSTRFLRQDVEDGRHGASPPGPSSGGTPLRMRRKSSRQEDGGEEHGSGTNDTSDVSDESDELG